MNDTKKTCYLAVKRPDPKFNHTWRGSELLDLHTIEKTIAKIEKYRAERLFVVVVSKREVICSVMVDEIQKNEDGTFLVKFKEIRRDHWVLPGAIKSFAGGIAEGPPPIPVPNF